RMWRNWPPKLLIADEVGLGKSITTGLLLRQAVLSGRARRILLMAPKAVLRQWQVELREKLNLNWPIYDGQRLTWFPSPALRGGHERAVARDAWHREPFVIVSSHLLRRADRQAEVLSAEPWDVVVLDEAHHARRKGAGGPQEGGPNRLLGLMRALRTRTQGLILLTATPMQVHPVEVWDLLDLLGLPPEWSKDAFLRFFEDLAQGNPSHEALDRMALLFQAAERHYGAIDEPPPETLGLASRLRAKKVLAALRDPASIPRRMLDADQRRAALTVLKRGSPVARLINRHTRELLRDYHRMGRLSTPIATREVKDHFITLSPGEREVYDAVERYIRSTYDAAARHGLSPRERTAIGFVMTIYRRRLASSFHALRCTLRSRLATLVDPAAGPLKSVDEDFDQDEVDAPEEEEAVALASDALRWEERQDIERLLAMSERLAPDTKLAELGKVIETLRAEGYAQVMVFTQFTDTMDFLRENLAARRDPGRIICLSGRGGEIRETDGTWRTVSRDEVKRRFRERQADLLLCTDAAAEGLNFQFCGALINYDSPWNPMRVEQRIGRIDRLGQQHEIIRVVNLHYADTVEAEVYSALRRRIGLFTKVVGGLQPILSRLPTLIGEGLAKGEHSGVVERIEEEIDRLEEGGGFDLDRSVLADMEALPDEPSALTLADLDRILARPELLPAGTEVRRLDNRTYGLRLPGADEIRVTADPDLFEEHAESMELWSPGNPCFP
ncbi:MAG: DEAD/DEAH box helicase, partial [Elioraea sp.]|nr:DEAD/DEAH box helicase [Elioraea sp.]